MPACDEITAAAEPPCHSAVIRRAVCHRALKMDRNKAYRSAAAVLQNGYAITYIHLAEIHRHDKIHWLPSRRHGTRCAAGARKDFRNTQDATDSDDTLVLHKRVTMIDSPCMNTSRRAAARGCDCGIDSSPCRIAVVVVEVGLELHELHMRTFRPHATWVLRNLR